MSEAPHTPPFSRNAWLLWVGQFVSAMGDALFLPCVGWLALATSGKSMDLGWVLFLNAVPFLLCSALAGALVDRHGSKRMMIASDIARALLLLALPVWAHMAGTLTMPMLMVTAVLLGTFSTPFVPARDALIPQLVGERSLTRWNAMFQMSGYVALALGFAFGGELIRLLHTADTSEVDAILRVLAIDGGTFLVSAVALALILVPKRKRTPAKTSVFREAREGVAYARKDRLVFGLLSLTALNNLFLMGPAIVGPLLLVRNTFGLGPAHLMAFELCMAGGMVAGAIFLARFASRWHPAHVFVMGLILDGITYLPFVWIDRFPTALVCIAFHGFFIPWIVVSRTTLLQRHVPAQRHGNVFALTHMTVTGVTALSCLGAGALAAWTGPRGLFGIPGVFATLTGIWAWLALRPRLRSVAASPRSRTG